MNLIKKRKNYIRRKNKTNTIAKKSQKSFRCIVNKSNKYNYLMVLNKDGRVIFMMSDQKIDASNKTEKARLLGKMVGDSLKEKGCTDIVFDRNGYLYHGRVMAMAEGLREGGIIF